MLYSVVIPCYRSDQTIEHVVDQTREEMVRLGRENGEFVLVNDCSPERRYRCCGKWQQNIGM